MGGATVQHQLSYAAACAHKTTCMKLGMRAGVGTTRRANFAVFYDSVARCACFACRLYKAPAAPIALSYLNRKSWAERSAAGEVDFSVNDVALRSADMEVVLEAQAVYDAHFGVRGPGRDAGKPAGMAVTLTCWLCRKSGHRASECIQKAGPKGGGKGGMC